VRCSFFAKGLIALALLPPLPATGGETGTRRAAIAMVRYGEGLPTYREL